MDNSESILLVANYASDVGYAWWLIENFWTEVAYAARSSDRRTILAYPKVNTVPETIRGAPVAIVEQDLRPSNVSDVISGIKLIRTQNVRSIYLTDWPAFSPLYMLWRLAGVKSIVLHDHTPGDRPRVDGLRGWLKAVAHRVGWFSCDAYVGVSDYIRRRLIDNWRIPPQRAFVVRNGIRPFVCDCAERNTVRARLGVPEGYVIVALVSRATYYKGWDFAVRCAADLLQRHPGMEFQMVFCGAGPDLAAFRGLSEELGIAHHLHFLGRRNDVRSILCSADVGFHPSQGEAMSLAVLEMMCAGLPVVVPNRPSVCGTVVSSLTGLIYEASDVSSAVDALASLCADKSLRATLGHNARITMLERHQLGETNRQFRDVVLPLLM